MPLPLPLWLCACAAAAAAKATAAMFPAVFGLMLGNIVETAPAAAAPTRTGLAICSHTADAAPVARPWERALLFGKWLITLAGTAALRALFRREDALTFPP